MKFSNDKFFTGGAVLSACGGWGEKDVNNLSLIFTGVFAGKMEKMDVLCLSYPQVVHILWIKLRKLPVYLFSYVDNYPFPKKCRNCLTYGAFLHIIVTMFSQNMRDLEND